MTDMTNVMKVRPVGQFDKNSCWAACLSWWLKAVGRKRMALSQSQLIAAFDNQYANTDGGISPLIFKNYICTDARFRLELNFFEPAYLPFIAINEPVIIVYNYPEVGGTHMNVIFPDPGSGSDQVVCMEPYYPLVAVDGRRTGTFVRRSLSHFMGSREIGIARAKEKR